MAHVRGVGRSQSSLFPESLDDFIGSDHDVRLIDGFVSTLDLVALPQAVPAKTVAAVRPADLKLLSTGTSHVRRVGAWSESQRNIELLWLRTGQPDHKTIANFRRDNGRRLAS
jgi:transposase